MIVYKLVWEDRKLITTEWLGTKEELGKHKKAVLDSATRRPFDQIEILFSGKTNIPLGKAMFLVWLNQQDFSNMERRKK